MTPPWPPRPAAPSAQRPPHKPADGRLAPATEDAAVLVHTKEHIDLIRRISRGDKVAYDEGYRHGVKVPDNPPFRGMHEAALVAAGGSLTGARLIDRGTYQHVFNVAG